MTTMSAADREFYEWLQENHDRASRALTEYASVKMELLITGLLSPRALHDMHYYEDGSMYKVLVSAAKESCNRITDEFPHLEEVD